MRRHKNCDLCVDFVLEKLTHRSREMKYLVTFDELGLAIFDGLYMAIFGGLILAIFEGLYCIHI